MKTRALVLITLLSGASCAHVKQEDLNTQLDVLRTGLETRMDEGDARLAGRVDGVEANVAQLRSDLRAMEQEFGVKVEELETALRFNVPVHFDFDRAEVPAPGREILDRFRGVATTYYPGARITVEGFTDPAGSASYNLRLGARRAEAVKDYLVAKGLADSQIRTVSYGKSAERLVVPDAQGPGTEGWENRRVVLVIDHAGMQNSRPVANEGEV